MTEQPWDFGRAVDAARRASAAQEGAEKALIEAAKEYAVKEEAYRVALALEIVRQHDAEGVAWTVAPDLARGNKNVARLRRERDIAEGVRDAMTQAAWRRSADRKDCQRFIDWSQRREFAEAAGRIPEPDDQPVYGGRRAA
jgi:DNA-binding transcriptional LysR family regulator